MFQYAKLVELTGRGPKNWFESFTRVRVLKLNCFLFLANSCANAFLWLFFHDENVTFSNLVSFNLALLCLLQQKVYFFLENFVLIA